MVTLMAKNTLALLSWTTSLFLSSNFVLS